jgi:hypothetical protein
MAENKGIGIPQTKGFFQVKGIVSGTAKERFSKETKTKTDKPFRAINFGVRTDESATTYINLTGMEQDKVYFSKTETVDGKKKTDTVEVAWKDRFKFVREGYKMIGVNIGVTKKKDEKGNDVNDKKTLTPYDACKEIGDNLRDDQSVFVKGNIEYSSYDSKGTIKRGTKFIPSQISLAKDIDFSDEKYEPQSDFTQVIVFMGIEQRDEDKKFVVSAKIVNYNSIEDAEFIVENKDIANAFRKNLKPYYALKVWGKISTIENTSEVKTTDVWGETNAMDKADAPIVRELIITGAAPETIEKETYSKEKVEAAIAKIKANKKAEKEYGSDNSGEGGNWGSANLSTSSSEGDEPW